MTQTSSRSDEERILALKQRLETLTKYKQAIELLEEGSVVAVSVLGCGDFHLTVKSDDATLSITYSGDISLADAIISASKVSMA